MYLNALETRSIPALHVSYVNASIVVETNPFRITFKLAKRKTVQIANIICCYFHQVDETTCPNF